MAAAIKHPVPDWVKPSFVILTSGHSDPQGWCEISWVWVLGVCGGTLGQRRLLSSLRMKLF